MLLQMFYVIQVYYFCNIVYFIIIINTIIILQQADVVYNFSRVSFKLVQKIISSN